jgi:hypothetical protein
MAETGPSMEFIIEPSSIVQPSELSIFSCFFQAHNFLANIVVDISSALRSKGYFVGVSF